MSGENGKSWHKALGTDELADGSVKTVSCGLATLCMTHHEGKYGALDNRCPHQGGPLGEGSIEKGVLRCPWHGWDFDPLTGRAPGFDDGVEAFPVEVREDGVYVQLPDECAHVRTKTDVVAETLVAWGVRSVFGMVGHSNLGMADALRRRAEEGELAYYGIRHEGAASFAASAYGKLTGRPAGCLAIAGPGSTNLYTGLWDAEVDRAPLVALCGQVDSQVLGPGAFQEIDLDAALGSVARFIQPLLASSKPGELATLACKTAILERGPSVLVFPDEVQTQPAGEAPAGSPAGRLPEPEIAPPSAALDAAVELLGAAKRPAIVVGHGARFDMPAVLVLAERLSAPILTTFKGKGLVADDHPLGCGVLGRSGTPVASWVMNECDALLVLGASFSNHTGITTKRPTVQVDRDPMILGKFHAVDVPVQGSIRTTAERLAERLADGAFQDQRPDVAERWRIWREEKQRRLAVDRGEGVHSAAVFEAMNRAVPDDAIVAVDVGNNTYSFGRYFEARAQSVLMSGYLGSIGFAFPAALGAWAATQEPGSPYAGRKVVSVSGDGGFGQYLAELTTAVKYGMDITHVLLDNDELGKISKEQRAGSWAVWQTALANPDFAAYAELCGAKGIRVERAEELDAALSAALSHDGPALVHVRTDAELI